MTTTAAAARARRGCSDRPRCSSPRSRSPSRTPGPSSRPAGTPLRTSRSSARSVTGRRRSTAIAKRPATSAGTEGHYYAAKAPGLALYSLPPWLVLERIPQIGDARDRAIWALNFWACVLPAILLFLLVRAVGDRLAPGTGLMSAIALGLGTMILPFATMYFAHIPAAAASFAAFALLVRERDGPFRPWVVFAAGLLAGVAVVFEYPTALIGLVLAGYVLGVAPRLARGAVYAAGAVVGALPLVAYHWLVYDSPFHTPYDDVVAVPGRTGHDVVGSNGEGFLGVTTPRFSDAVSLLIDDDRGLSDPLAPRRGRDRRARAALARGTTSRVADVSHDRRSHARLQLGVHAGLRRDLGRREPGAAPAPHHPPVPDARRRRRLPPGPACRHRAARRIDGDLRRRDGHVPPDRRRRDRAVDLVGVRARILVHPDTRVRGQRARRLAVRRPVRSRSLRGPRRRRLGRAGRAVSRSQVAVAVAAVAGWGLLVLASPSLVAVAGG